MADRPPSLLARLRDEIEERSRRIFPAPPGAPRGAPFRDARTPVGALVAGRRVVLVGNASSLRIAPIDTFEVIVRINAGALHAATHPGLATRTDILLLSGLKMAKRLDREMRKVQAPRLTVFMSEANRAYMPDRLRAAMTFYPVEWWHALHAEIGALPSTGCMGIDLLTRLAAGGEVHLYGFDFWRSPTSYNGRLKIGPHDPVAEEAFARRRIPAERIHAPPPDTTA
jgi:hypothetical protein